MTEGAGRDNRVEGPQVQNGVPNLRTQLRGLQDKDL